MLNFSKINNICCWTLVAFILLPKFDIGKTSSNFSQHHLAKREVPCSQNQFRCRSDNKCIDRSEKCDGEKHCADGSDETAQLCGEISFRSASRLCTIPQVSPDKHLNVGGHEPGKKVPEFTKVSFKCNPGYRYVLGETFTSTCIERNWSPPIENCIKICKPLKPQNVDLKCSRNGYEIKCESTLLTGTTVEPSCKPYHQAVKSTQSGNYKMITCEEDGEWSNPLYACTPSFSECGKLFANTAKLGEHGPEEKYGDSPWHVAIYDVSNKDKPLTCGGTIISAQLVISAARCFYDGSAWKPYNAEKYEIAVSKVTRNYNKKDNRQTKFHKIREIKFSPKGYNGYTDYYAVDIVILRVTEDISLSPQVLPACIPSQENRPFRPEEGAVGKLAGWGWDENGKESEIIFSANSSHTDGECSKIASSNLKKFITYDKLCARLITTGVYAREEDFGAGLLYPNGNAGLYYLHGIVSVVDSSKTSVVLFTNVDKYLDWIIDTKNKLENDEISTKTTSNSAGSPRSCILPQILPDKYFTVKCPDYTNCKPEPGDMVPEFTGVSFKCNPGYHYDNEEIFTSNCSNGNWLPPIKNCKRACKALKPKTVDLKCSRHDHHFQCKGALIVGTVVRIHCKPRYRQEHPVNYDSISCQENSQWSRPLFRCIPECGKPKSFTKVKPLISHGTKEDHEESPWHVAIYDISGKNEPSLICGGTIISPQLIVSAAHCFYSESSSMARNPEDYEIAVGKITRSYNNKTDSQYTKFHKIREISFSKKGYGGSVTNYAGDIAILRVTEDISLNQAVLPACIRSFQPEEDELGKLVGWGEDENETPSENLLSANLPYISYRKCVGILPRDFKGDITLDKFCAGSKIGPGARAGDSGGGLLYTNVATGQYYLQGIVSISLNIGNSPETSRTVVVFTDMEQYVGWINETMNKVENEVLSSETDS